MKNVGELAPVDLGELLVAVLAEHALGKQLFVPARAVQSLAREEERTAAVFDLEAQTRNRGSTCIELEGRAV